MLGPVKVLDLELSERTGDLEGLQGYVGVQALARLHGSPLGFVRAPVVAGGCRGAVLRSAAVVWFRDDILRHLVEDGLGSPSGLAAIPARELAEVRHPDPPAALPSLTVAVCSRDRPGDLELSLQAVSELDYPELDVVVVDNAPLTDATRVLVERRFPSFRYILEPRPGLDWARNRALAEARGEILAYTDDDVVVDGRWAREIGAAFAEEPDIAAVTGLVVPFELETPAQQMFEHYRGFGRGFRRRVFRFRGTGRERRWKYGTGECGTGANMAFRRTALIRLGGFDPALDVGTATNGGGDLEIFFRLQQEGAALLYQPSAIVRHRHRRELESLRAQLAGNGSGLYGYFGAAARRYPEERAGLLRFGLWWFAHWNIRRWLRSFAFPQRLPRSFILAELEASIRGLLRYRQARRRAEELAALGPTPAPAFPPMRAPGLSSAAVRRGPERGATAVRRLELTEPVRDLTDVDGAERVRVFVTRDDVPVGMIEMESRDGAVTAPALRAQLAAELGIGLVGARTEREAPGVWAEAMAGISAAFGAAPDSLPKGRPRLDETVLVTVVIATYDRPEDLRNCLRSLHDKPVSRPVEILVVDNHPASGLTPPVVAEFPDVVLVEEPRRGLAYARNKGFTSARGEILVATDDDVLLPEGWLEEAVAPFGCDDVGAVTGHVLPLELETAAQRSFEAYGGLGRGFQPFEVDRDWFDNCYPHPVPTWRLGATANAAFRRAALAHPDVGLMDEALGPGTPTGVGEDTYLFYRLLKAGYRIVYEPRAYLWHRHRRELHNVRKQLYAYSKGHVAYHLTTLLRDGDMRALTQLFYNLPVWHYLKEIVRQIRGRGSYPLDLLLAQMAGSAVGPWSLWMSRRRVRREGRSDPLPIRVVRSAPAEACVQSAPAATGSDRRATA